MVEEEAEGEEASGMVDVFSLDIYPLLSLFISILSAQAWQYMGLRLNPATKKVEKDFLRASVAIDCIAFLIDKLEPQLSGDEKNRFRGLLTDLQINFVRQQSSPTSKPESQC